MEIKDIVWKQGLYNFEYGYINGRRLFSIGWDGKGYQLDCELPRIKSQHTKERFEAKELAKNIVKYFISTLLANPPE